MTRGSSAGVDRSRRRASLVLVAAIVALAGVLAPARAPLAAAASGGLVLTTATTYTIVSARALVRVVMDVAARNDKPNTTANGIVTRYYYESARFAIQSEARNVRATSGGARLVATTKPDDGFAILEVRFPKDLFFRQTTKLRITFDLPGGAPRSASEIRVGRAFATFTAWAFGDGGSVQVVVPAGFSVETSGSDLIRSTSDGATVLRATGIDDTAAWYAVVVADRKSGLAGERLPLSGEAVVVRGWPEDPAWRRQVADLLTGGLPKLASATGLDWPVEGDLEVFEVHTPLLEGYAGVFLQGENRIEISEDLDELTILHEASHAWFNGTLFTGRWINEGFADTYAAHALEAIGIGGWEPNDVDPGDAAAVRLGTWEHPGRIDDKETDAREQYGYEASWTVVRSLVAEIGEASMRRVLAAARARTIPYTGAGTPEPLVGPADWRRFLDLLEEVGGSRTAEATFRRWVLTDTDTASLAERTAARTAYAELARVAGDWAAPFSVREPMSAWRFSTAKTRIAEATAILRDRDAIAALAAQLGVAPPGTLRTSYETARATLADPAAVATGQLAAARALVVADAAVDAPRDMIVSLGLLGSTPEADLAAALGAFSGGAGDAETRAVAVSAVLAGAAEIGRGRLAAGIAALVVLLVLLALLVLVVSWRRRSARSRRSADSRRAAEVALAAAGPTGLPDETPTSPSGPAPYGTLADQSGEPAPVAQDPPDPAGATRPPPPATGDDNVSQQA